MKLIGNIITALAVFALMMGMCMIESNPAAALIVMFFSGSYLAVYSYYHEEKRLKEGRR